MAVLLASLAGCASVGPQIAVSSRGQVRAGWEASALTVSTGQTYRLASAAPGPRRRTYVAWEPGFGGILTPHAQSTDALGFAGGGLTLGARWDTSDDGTVGGGMIGAWGSTVIVTPPIIENRCDWEPHGYVSFTLGVRDDEFYFAPKLGVVAIPDICFSN